MENIFFDSWESVLRTLTSGVISYVVLIFILRIVGNRTLSQLNAFDFIVTVALGSTLATVMLSKDVAIVDGILALALLIGLQLLITKASIHSRMIRSIVKTEPFLLFFKGNYLPGTLYRHRITKDEILQVVRSNGLASLSDVDAIILETNGKFSVIKKFTSPERSSLDNVIGVPFEKQ